MRKVDITRNGMNLYERLNEKKIARMRCMNKLHERIARTSSTKKLRERVTRTTCTKMLHETKFGKNFCKEKKSL